MEASLRKGRPPVWQRLWFQDPPLGLFLVNIATGKPGNAQGEHCPVNDDDGAELLAWNLMDEASDRRILDVILVDDGKAGLDMARQAGDARRIGDGELHGHVAHVKRFLSEHQGDDSLVHQFDSCLGRVISDNLYMAAETSIDHRRAGALSTEYVGAEHTSQIGVLLEDRGCLLLSLVHVVEIIVGSKNLDVRELLRHHLSETLFPAFDRADIGIGRVYVDGALAADRLGQTSRGNAPAFDVVRTDVADWELDRAGHVIAVAQESVDGNHFNACVERSLQRADHLVLVGRCGDDVIQVATCDHRVENRRLRLDAPSRRNLGHDFQAQILGGRLNTKLHHLIERIHYAGQKADLDLVCSAGRL